MATRLEQIVQPFLPQVATPAKQGTLNLPVFAPYVIFRVRATGGQVKQGYGKYSITYYAIKKHNEKTSQAPT